MPFDVPLQPRRRTQGPPRRETPYAAAAFAEYCALGPRRSLVALALKLANGDERVAARRINYLRTLSPAFHWSERVKAYDQAHAEAERDQRERRWTRLNNEQARIGERATQLAIQYIERVLHDPDGRYGVQSLAQLLKIGSELERTAVVAAYEQDKQHGPSEVQIVLLTDDRPLPALAAPLGTVVDAEVPDAIGVSS